MDEQNETTAAAERAEADKPRRRRPSRAKSRQAPAGPRAAIEAGETMVIGPMDTVSAGMAEALAEGAPDDVVENMEVTRIRRKLGQEVDPADFLDQDAIERARDEDAPERRSVERVGEPMVVSVAATNEQYIRDRPAERVDDLTRFAEPGLTERGWSAEVTARHPKVMAATMADLMTASDGARTESIDPHDPVAVANALTEQGFGEVRRDMLRSEAARVGATRLAAAQGVAASQSGATAAAHERALDRAEYEASARGGTAPPSDREIERSR